MVSEDPQKKLSCAVVTFIGELLINYSGHSNVVCPAFCTSGYFNAACAFTKNSSDECAPDSVVHK
jgi:hypothetical protein